MKVKVYAPMGSSNVLGMHEDNTVDLPDDATVGDVYKILTIPSSLSTLFICTVNNRSKEMSTPLKDGDIIRFTYPYAGG